MIVMFLFQNAPDQAIIDFYREIREMLSGKDYRILYLLTENIPSSISIIRKVLAIFFIAILTVKTRVQT